MSKNSFPVFFTSNSFKNWRQQTILSIGFVPTMGNLHQGHIKLVEEALKNHDCVVVSIFVNPTQFGPSEDFDRYPRTLDQDIKLLEEILESNPHKQLALFSPNHPSEIYQPHFSTFVTPKLWANILEGEFRPGHFEGVCTVVSILLHIVCPQVIYLGKKDYQQLRILECMLRDLHHPTQLKPVDTIRNDQGLALSSRNSFLSSEQLTMASRFPQTLKTLSQELSHLWNHNHHWDNQQIQNLFELHKSKSQLTWDYLELRQQSFSELEQNSEHLVLLGVVRIGNTRLLDNIEFDVKKY